MSSYGSFGNWTKRYDKEDGSTYWVNDDNPDQVVNFEPGSDQFLSALYGDESAGPGAGLSNGMARNPYNGLVDYGNGVQSVFTRQPTLVYNQDTGQAYVQMPDGTTRRATSADSSLPVLNYSPNQGNAGHGSWLDQQGSEIIGNALYGAGGYFGGPAFSLLAGAANSGDTSAEAKRDTQFSALGSLAGSIFGSPSTTGSNISDTGGDISGGSGSGTLAGDAGNDTLQGGSTDNYFGDYITDPNTGDVTTASDISGGVDEFGNPTSGDLNFSGGGTNDFYNPFAVDATGAATGATGGIDWSSIAQKYGTTAAKYLYNAFQGSSNQKKQTVGQGILGQLTGDPLGSAFSSLPFILALNEANKQGGDINDVLGRLRNLEGSVSGNQSPYMDAVLNPYDRETGTGRAALMQDQLQRGIRGSSFGDQSINNYDYTRGVGRGDIASKALLGSTALQGNLIGSELDAITKRNTNRNLLLGAGLSASGKLFQPEKDPFNLSTLLGLRT